GIRDATVTGVQTCALPILAGTKQFGVKLSEAGTTNTVTAADLTDGLKAPGASAIGVSARFTSAIGGSAIPAITAGGTYTSLTGRSEERRVGKECRSEVAEE